MTATSLDLSQIKTDALSAASTFRTLIGLGTGDTPTFKGATLSTGTITASTPALDATQTWNNAAVTFTGSKINITDTASASGSLLADWQVGGVSRVSFPKLGGIALPGSVVLGGAYYNGTNYTAISNDPSLINITGQSISFSTCGGVSAGSTFSFASRLTISNSTGVTFGVAAGGSSFSVSSSGTFGFSQDGNWYSTRDIILARDAAGTLAQRNGTNQQRFNLYGTYSDASNYRRLYLDSTTAGAFTIGVEGAGSGASGNTLALQTGGTTRLTIESSGIINATNNIRFANGSTGIDLLQGTITAPSAGVVQIDSWTGAKILVGNAQGACAVDISGSQTRVDGHLHAGYFNDLAIQGGGTYSNNQSGGHLRLVGGGRSNTETGVTGGNVYIHGGNGDLRHGNVVIGHTGSALRSNTGIGNASPLAKLDIADTWNSNVTVTGASGNGTTATLTFSAMTNAFPVGSTIVVSSVNPSGYNGTFTVTASTTTSVSYANATTGAYVSGGNIQQQFTGIKLNVTDTASASGSLLQDWQVGGSSQFQFTKNRQLYINSYQSGYSSSNYEGFLFNGGPQGGSVRHGLTARYGSASNGIMLWALGVGYAGVANWGAWFNTQIGFSSTDVSFSNPDTFLVRDAANVLAVRYSTAAQNFRLYGTYTDSGNYNRLALTSTTGGNYVLQPENAGTSANAGSLTINLSGNPTYKAQIEDNGGGINFRLGGLPFVIQMFGDAIMPAGANTGSVGHEGYSRPWQYVYANRYSAGGLSLTGSQATSLFDATATWNTTGTPTLIKANVTDTASNAASLLMDLQVGGSSKAGITKAGKIFSDAAANLDWFSGRYAGTEYIRLGYQGSIGYGLFSGSAYSGNTGNGFGIGSTVNIVANTTWGSGTSSATFITFSHANNTSPVIKLERVGYTTKPAILIDQTTGTTSYPFEVQLNSVRKHAVASSGNVEIYNAFTNDSNYERGKLEWSSNVFRIGTEKAGTGSARALELQTDGTTRLTIASTGAATFSSSIDCTSVLVNGSQNLAEFTHLTRLSLSVGGGGYSVVRLGGVYQSANTLITIGGTTSSFPAIKRNGTAINFRLADDSADCDVTAAALTLSGNLTISTKNIVTDTTTGTKIGTATTQKLGFYNATPVVQPTAVADATDAASVITQLNALLSRMRDLGLIAT